MSKIIRQINCVVWGAPALILILGVGLFLTIRLGAVQISLFPRALKHFRNQLKPADNSKPGISSRQALCTALAATVGTGNLVGVAGAICLGGPGVVFWMWLSGLLGMATKFTEVVLAVRYRVRTGNTFSGGPMYIITNGLSSRFHWLAVLYCTMGIAASFGVGNATQINAAVTGINGVQLQFGWVPTTIGNLRIGLILAAILGALLFGGAKCIGRAAEQLVPFAAVGYVLLCLGVLVTRRRYLPEALGQIFRGAFTPAGVTGGMIGSAFLVLRIGCSRGVFTNEAGMGTASIAHACADCSHPVQQGLMGVMEVFLDTIVICTLTALVILLSGVSIPYGTDAGGSLTTDAFVLVYGENISIFISAVMILLAVATILGWSFYGIRCVEFLFGNSAGRWFAAAQMFTIAASSVMKTETIWQLSEAVNGLMAIPNLITLTALSSEAVRLTKEYRKSGM